MTVVSMGLHVLARKVKDPPEVAAQIVRLQAAAQALATELHSVAASLHPDALTRLGLVPAVREHLGNLQTTEGPQLQLEAAGFDDGRLACRGRAGRLPGDPGGGEQRSAPCAGELIKVVMEMQPGSASGLD